jgi:hypothetical protein
MVDQLALVDVATSPAPAYSGVDRSTAGAVSLRTSRQVSYATT